jgi:hypothetical protein
MLAIGTQVRVHKNLRRGDWSVTVRGRVVAHVPAITLANVTFKVSEARRQAVIKQHAREVHAWCEGTIAAPLPAAMPRVAITYNPFRCGSFHRRDNGTPLAACQFVEFTDSARAAGLIRPA